MDAAVADEREVPQALIAALFHHPDTLAAALAASGVAPHELAMWARRTGTAPEIEKLAGWFSVGQQPGRYKPLLEAAATHLRAGELEQAAPVFRWAYQAWRNTPGAALADQRRDGLKLLALWGECLGRLGQPIAARERWLAALSLVVDAPDDLQRLARMMERGACPTAYEAVLAEARRRGLAGAAELWARWQRLQAGPANAEGAGTDAAGALGNGDGDANPGTLAAAGENGVSRGLALIADVSNLELVGQDQFGPGRPLDYGRLARAAERNGELRAALAFVPDLPETLEVRGRLVSAGFTVELQRPKRSHGRISANADAAIGAAAARWASEPGMGRVELWTGDGDFVKVREILTAAWPHVAVTFRSFATGTSQEIQRLPAAWEPIGPQFLAA